MKLLILVAVLAFVNSQDTVNTTGVLLGSWTLVNVTANSSSQCCVPSGNVTITSNDNNTITLSSSNWTGAECNGRTSSFNEVFLNVTGTQSWAQIINGSLLAPENGGMLIDTNGTVWTFLMEFIGSLDALVISPVGPDSCATSYMKIASENNTNNTDNANTPGILIGSWNAAAVTSSANCCLPSGVMTITNNGNDSISLSSTTWDGGLCGSRSSDFALLINDIDGSDSWNQISYGLPALFFSYNNNTVYMTLAFSNGQDYLAMNVDGQSDCNSGYIKAGNGTDTGAGTGAGPSPQSANLLAIFGTGLVAVVTALLI